MLALFLILVVVGFAVIATVALILYMWIQNEKFENIQTKEKQKSKDLLEQSSKKDHIYKMWMDEQVELQRNGVSPGQCLSYERWLEWEYPKKLAERERHAQTHRTDYISTLSGVITFEYPLSADLTSIRTKLEDLAKQRSINLKDYEHILGVKILRVDVPNYKIGFKPIGEDW